MAAFSTISSSSSDVSETDIIECSMCHGISDPHLFCLEHAAYCSSCKSEKCSCWSDDGRAMHSNGLLISVKKTASREKLPSDELKKYTKFLQVLEEIHCPFTVCKESARPDVPVHEFISHLTNEHRVISSPDGDRDFTREMYVGKGNIWRFKRDGPKSPFLLRCYDFQFIQHSFCADGNIWFWLSILGSKNDAEKFKTVLTVSHPSNKGRKLVWAGCVHVVNTTEIDVHNSGQCLVLQKSMLDDYMDMENDKMLWKLKIEIELRDDMLDTDCLLPDDSQDNWNVPKENSPPKSQLKRRLKGKGRKSKNC